MLRQTKIDANGHVVILFFFLSAGTLDLPQVEVLVNGQVATVTFPNPMRIHPELKWAAGRESDPLCLTFDVTENNVREIKMFCWTVSSLVLDHL